MMDIKMTDLLRAVAEAGVAVSEKAGRQISLVSMYDKDISSLALAAGYMRLCLEKAMGCEIKIIDDRLSKVEKGVSERVNVNAITIKGQSIESWEKWLDNELEEPVRVDSELKYALEAFRDLIDIVKQK